MWTFNTVRWCFDLGRDFEAIFPSQRSPPIPIFLTTSRFFLISPSYMLLVCRLHLYGYFFCVQLISCVLKLFIVLLLPSSSSSNQNTTKIRNCVYFFRHKQKFIPVFSSSLPINSNIFLVFLGLFFHFSRALGNNFCVLDKAKSECCEYTKKILWRAAW